MTDRQLVMSFVASVALVAILMPAFLVLAARDENSAWVKIGSGEKQTGLESGEVLGDAKVVDDKCSMPDVSMGLAGDLRYLRIGVDNDTCKIVVKEINVREETAGSSAGQGLDGRPLPAGSSVDWQIEALAKVAASIR